MGGGAHLEPEQVAAVLQVMRQLLTEMCGGKKVELGRRLGITGQAVSQLLSGKNSPSYQVAKRVALLANIDLADLLRPAPRAVIQTSVIPKSSK